MKRYQFLTNVFYNNVNYDAGSVHELSDLDAANNASEVREVAGKTIEPEKVQIIDGVVPEAKAVEAAPNKMQKKRKKK